MAHEIVIPRLGWSMEQGTFVGWLKRDGDVVRLGDPLFELEGEKAAQDIEAVDEGILRIPVTAPAPGTVVNVGTVVGYLAADGEVIPGMSASPQGSIASGVDISATPPAAAPSVRRLAREAGIPLSRLSGSGPGGRVLPEDIRRATGPQLPGVAGVSQTSAKRTVVASAVPVAELRRDSPPPSAKQRVIASPRARRVASELGIDWSQLVGTGGRGQVRERDVRAAFESRRQNQTGLENVVEVSSSGVKPTTQGTFRGRPASNHRRTIAAKMLASRQQTAAVTLTRRVDATNLVSLRQQFKVAGNLPVVPSLNDIIIKLVAASLKQHPWMAARWDGDSIAVPNMAEIHIGLAVDTDGGLLVPVVRDISSQTLPQLAKQSRDLIERARAGKLTIAEMQGGLFTVTSLGVFGVDAFTPIINWPQAAILGLGAIRREPVVREDGQIVPRDLLTLSLTFDHCLIDGAPAARFLQTLVEAITNPSAWLLGE